MILAKQQRANPAPGRAADLSIKLEVSDVCEAPEIAGAGFINFRLSRTGSLRISPSFAADAAARCASARSSRRRWCVDFSSPNVAKPMHVGHIRSTIMGDALARIAEFHRPQVVRDNHIGDWGTQFGMLLVGWKTDLDRAALAADPLAEMERIYKLINARCKEDPPTHSSRARARQELVKLQSGDAENLAIWREMIRLSQVQFDTIYSRLGVKFDVTLGESFYNPRLKEVVQRLVRSRDRAGERRRALRFLRWHGVSGGRSLSH